LVPQANQHTKLALSSARKNSKICGGIRCCFEKVRGFPVICQGSAWNYITYMAATGGLMLSALVPSHTFMISAVVFYTKSSHTLIP